MNRSPHPGVDQLETQMPLSIISVTLLQSADELQIVASWPNGSVQRRDFN